MVLLISASRIRLCLGLDFILSNFILFGMIIILYILFNFKLMGQLESEINISRWF